MYNNALRIVCLMALADAIPENQYRYSPATGMVSKRKEIIRAISAIINDLENAE